MPVDANRCQPTPIDWHRLISAGVGWCRQIVLSAGAADQFDLTEVFGGATSKKSLAGWLPSGIHFWEHWEHWEQWGQCLPMAARWSSFSREGCFIGPSARSALIGGLLASHLADALPPLSLLPSVFP
jgi:hypothetical protein